jgi:hypothetical protein
MLNKNARCVFGVTPDDQGPESTWMHTLIDVFKALGIEPTEDDVPGLCKLIAFIGTSYPGSHYWITSHFKNKKGVGEGNLKSTVNLRNYLKWFDRYLDCACETHLKLTDADLTTPMVDSTVLETTRLAAINLTVPPNYVSLAKVDSMSVRSFPGR